MKGLYSEDSKLGNIQRNIIDKEIEPNEIVYDNEITFLMLMYGYGYYKNYESLVKKANLELTDSKGNTALHYAVSELNNLTKYRSIEYKEDIRRYHNEKLENIKILLIFGANVNKPNDLGITPFHYVASKNSPQAVKLFLDYGANPNLKDNEGRTPLHYACEYSTPDHTEYAYEVGKLLLQYGCSPLEADSEGYYPLTYALSKGSKDLGEIIIEYGGKVDLNSHISNWAFYFTSDKDFANYLLDLGVDINFYEEKYFFETRLIKTIKNFIRSSASEELNHCFELLKRGANPNITDGKGISPLRHLLENSSNKELLLELIRYGANVNEVGISEIAIDSPSQIFEILFRNGLCLSLDEYKKVTQRLIILKDIHLLELLLSKNTRQYDIAGDMLENALDVGDTSVISVLIRNNSKQLNSKLKKSLISFATKNNGMEFLQFLIEDERDLEVVDSNKNTLLHLAITHKHNAVVNFLLQHQQKIESKNKRGEEPIHLAILTNNIQAVYGLTAKKVRLETRLENYTPAEVALINKNEEIYKILISNGAKLKTNPKTKETHLILANSYNASSNLVQKIIEYGVNLDKADDLGNTALHYSCKNNSIQNTEVLLKNKANPNIMNKGKITPLIMAVQKNDYELTKILLEFGSDPNHKLTNLYKDSLLIHCIKEGKTRTIQLLLENKVDLNMQNDEGDTALHIAAGVGYIDVVKQLLELGAVRSIKNKKGFTPVRVATYSASKYF